MPRSSRLSLGLSALQLFAWTLSRQRHAEAYNGYFRGHYALNLRETVWERMDRVSDLIEAYKAEGN